MSCHEGIEQIPAIGKTAELTCIDCPKGDGGVTDVETVHGMYANPSDLRVADEVWGECHEEELAAVKTSIHATMAGISSGTRYDFGA